MMLPLARAVHARAPIRVLLVDDSPEFLMAAARFLATVARIVIVGHALSGRDALMQIGQHQPDLVLIDLFLPGVSALNVTAAIKSGPDAPRVIVLTVFDSHEYRDAIAAAHADSYIAKSDFGTRLLPVIDALFA